MKIPSFKRSDPKEGLAAALAAVEAERADLIGQRDAKLLEQLDDIGPIVDDFDRKIERLNRVVRAREDQVRAFEAAVQRAAAEQAAREHAAKVATAEQALAVRNAAAEALEKALEEYSKMFFALLEANIEVNNSWALSDRERSIGFLDTHTIVRETANALLGAGRARNGSSLLPGASSAGLGIAGDNTGPQSFAGRIKAASAWMVDNLLRRAPIRDAA
jgi:uncharacterized protein YoxC